MNIYKCKSCWWESHKEYDVCNGCDGVSRYKSINWESEPFKLPKMCNTCHMLTLVQICRDYDIPMKYEHSKRWIPWVKQPNGDYTKTVSYTIKPDFDQWDGKTGL